MTVKNEAVWALSNCTASASPDQFQLLVNKGLIKALGSVLAVQDVRMLAVALEGLENTLSCGQKHFVNIEGENMFSIIMEQEGCLDDLEKLQQHPNHSIYDVSLRIISNFFSDENEEEPLLQALNNPSQNQMQMNNGGLFDL